MVRDGGCCCGRCLGGGNHNHGFSLVVSPILGRRQNEDVDYVGSFIDRDETRSQIFSDEDSRKFRERIPIPDHVSHDGCGSKFRDEDGAIAAAPDDDRPRLIIRGGDFFSGAGRCRRRRRLRGSENSGRPGGNHFLSPVSQTLPSLGSAMFTRAFLLAFLACTPIISPLPPAVMASDTRSPFRIGYSNNKNPGSARRVFMSVFGPFRRWKRKKWTNPSTSSSTADVDGDVFAEPLTSLDTSRLPAAAVSSSPLSTSSSSSSSSPGPDSIDGDMERHGLLLDDKLWDRAEAVSLLVSSSSSGSVEGGGNEKGRAGMVRADTADNLARPIVLMLAGIVTAQAVGTLLTSGNYQRLVDEVAARFLSKESVRAVRTIREILAGVSDEYGVVDIFGKYSKQAALMSAYAYSRLQHAAAYYDDDHRNRIDGGGCREGKVGSVVGGGGDFVRNATAADAAVVSARDPSTGATVQDVELLENLAHYSVYATVAYGWAMDLALRGRLHLGGDVQALLRRTGIPPEDIVVATWEAKTHRPAYFVVRDRSRKSVVLGIRGTWSPRDMLTNLCCAPKEFDTTSTTTKGLRDEGGDAVGTDAEGGSRRARGFIDGFFSYAAEFCGFSPSSSSSSPSPAPRSFRAHHGMLDAALAVKRDVEGILREELRSNPDYSLVLVGHSLGGGVAAVLGRLFLLGEVFPDLIVYVYGPPCVFPIESTRHPAGWRSSDDEYDGDDRIISVVAEGDPFCRLSLGHVADVSVGLSLLCEDAGLRRAILSRTGRRLRPADRMDRLDLEWCSNTMGRLRRSMTAEKLYPPGRLLLLSKNNKDEGGGVGLRDVPRVYFRDLVIGPRMFDIARHVPSLYESNLYDLARKLRNSSVDAERAGV